ncbi:Cyanovirin-N [Mycena leptocephala]|nr:Cyanovirin-N [Mycena leptocephala]KAJ7882932.1 Cyanovirin-N [Mycena leptocephala]
MNTFLSSVLLALCAVAVVPGALAAPVKTRTGSNFSSACDNIVIDTHELTLTATCQKSGGIGSSTTTIDLNSCIGNTNGELVAGNSFAASCSNLQASGVELTASCTNPAGTTINTAIDLNVVVGNDDGSLTC